jgi:hypothetical protein
VTVRDLSEQAATTPVPTAQRRNIGLCPGLVDEDKPLGIDALLMPLPALAPPGNVRPILLGGEDAFF